MKKWQHYFDILKDFFVLHSSEYLIFSSDTHQSILSLQYVKILLPHFRVVENLFLLLGLQYFCEDDSNDVALMSSCFSGFFTRELQLFVCQKLSAPSTVNGRYAFLIFSNIYSIDV